MSQPPPPERSSVPPPPTGGQSGANRGGANRSGANRSGANRSGDRLRWGLTGLAAVFLIVMVAAGLRPTGGDNKPGTGEPLAVLGVAPGPATRPPETP